MYMRYKDVIDIIPGVVLSASYTKWTTTDARHDEWPIIAHDSTSKQAKDYRLIIKHEKQSKFPAVKLRLVCMN